jgi:hypothetical protein
VSEDTGLDVVTGAFSYCANELERHFSAVAPEADPIARRDHGRWAFALTVLACAWGLALIAAAMLVPVYSSQATYAPGAMSAMASATLVQVNGPGVLIAAAVPALLASAASVALHRRCTKGGRAGGFVAWSLTWILFALCVVGIASIGIFVLPVPALLAAAAALTPGPRPRLALDGVDH